jgi:DNA invertase Pin-like site-specific DNA recombinase
MKKLGLTAVPTKQAALYLRVSTGAQAMDGISLDAQERLNRTYAAEHGYHVDERHVYREAHSGGDLQERSRLMLLLAAARRSEFQTVIVDCLDRWVRDSAFDGWLETELRFAAVRVEFATETYAKDFSGGVQRLLKSQFAQEERRKISQRCRKAYEERLEQGRMPAIGPPPYGYRADKVWVDTKRGPVYKATGTLLVDTIEAEVVRRIFAWVTEGWSLRGIARQLNEAEVPPPSASTEKRYARSCQHWGVSTLSGIIKDPVYRGERRVRRQRSLAVDPEERLNRAQCGLSAASQKILRPEEEWVLLPCAALVSEPEWHEAQTTLKSRAGIFRTRNCETTARREAHPALLRGIIYCAQPGCGRRLHPGWQETGRLVYRCCSRNQPGAACGAAGVNGALVEQQLKERLQQFFRDPAEIQKELARRALPDGKDDLAAELERQYRLQMVATRKQERLISLFAGATEGEMPVALIQQQIIAAERERQGLDAVVAALKARHEQQQAAQEQGQQLVDYIQRVSRHLTQFTFEQWREVLTALRLRIFAAGEQWRAEVTLDPDAPTGDGVLSIHSSSSRQNTLFIYALRALKA